jgi:hypothetical protein
MLKKISKFLDFDPERVGTGLILDEFNHKFGNSWVLLEGLPTLIKDLYINEEGFPILRIIKHKEEATIINDFTTIENFSPKTGLYSLEDTLLYLKRIPNKQWRKGFCMGSNYEIIQLKGRDRQNSIDIIINPKTKYNTETIIHKKELYLHWKYIGNVDNIKRTITLFNNHFEKETKELWKQYKVGLEVPFPKNAMEENLIMDF